MAEKDPIEKTMEEDLPQVDLTKPIKSKRTPPKINQQPPSFDQLKLQMESLLFASARRVPAEEIASLCNTTLEEVKKAFQELKKDYDSRQTTLQLIDEDDGYKFTVREKFIHIVQNVVVETELSKSVLETLAVIAYKHPCLQSEVIKIRTNKAYDHLHELEQLGYITREPHGRTRKIKLTPKFFEYFDLPREKLKEAFAAFEAVEKAIGVREEENEKLREKFKKMESEAKKETEQHKEKAEKELEKLGDLDVFEEKVHKAREKVEGEHLGNLEVFVEPKSPEEEPTEETETVEESAEEPEEAPSEEVSEPTPPESVESPEEGPTEQPEPSEEPSEPIKQPKPSEASEESYGKFLGGQKTEQPKKEITFKKTERPLITRSEEEIEKRAEAILHPEQTEDVDNPHLAGIPSDDKQKAKDMKREVSVDKTKDYHTEEEGVDLIESAQSERTDKPKGKKKK